MGQSRGYLSSYQRVTRAGPPHRTAILGGVVPPHRGTESRRDVTPRSVQSRGRLLIVTGSGRSGTSTVAGALKRLGLHIPQPEIPPDETNPRGFFESQWVVDFHKRLLNSVPARTNDARPCAAERIRALTSTDAIRAELQEWLAQHIAEVGAGGQILVKDPRAFWFHELWTGVADELGLDVSYLTMLRHPAEVVKSRDHYVASRTDDFRRTRQTANLAGWVNTAFETELATRSRPRLLVRYVDLLADWRAVMAHAQQHLALRYNADLGAREHHPVDEFIDVTLRRSNVTWDDTPTLPELRELAVGTWEAVNTLVGNPYDEGAIAALQEMRPRYVALHQYAEAIALDHTNISVVQERRAVRARFLAQAQTTKGLHARLVDRARLARGLRRRLEEGRAASGRLRLRWRR
jgi:hypothetical protein